MVVCISSHAAIRNKNVIVIRKRFGLNKMCQHQSVSFPLFSAPFLCFCDFVTFKANSGQNLQIMASSAALRGPPRLHFTIGHLLAVVCKSSLLNENK